MGQTDKIVGRKKERFRIIKQSINFRRNLIRKLNARKIGRSSMDLKKIRRN